MAKITQNAIAQRLGVSRSTVAAALNPASTIHLNAETRQRILEAAEELNYRPDRYARVMRGGRSGLIGMLHFGGLLQVAAERAAYAAAAVRRHQFEVVASDLSWATGSIHAACASLLDARVEGVIVAGWSGPSALQPLERLRSAGIPLVTLSGNPLPWGPHFRGDTRSAIAALTRHLIARGHRRLSLLTSREATQPLGRHYLWSASARREGFTEALREAGGRLVKTFGKKEEQIEGCMVVVEVEDDPFDPFLPGARGMEAVLRLPRRPTALLCSNDEFAHGALSVCQRHGIEIPGQLALTGYDDTSVGRYAAVPLTTVRQPNEAMAEAAVDALLEMIESGEHAPPSRTTLFPCEVVIRASSGG